MAPALSRDIDAVEPAYKDILLTSDVIRSLGHLQETILEGYLFFEESLFPYK
jgi:hypothetical protein